ncbi:uncharacterized protein TEOVI_000090100 [Trypanosoma equiperdum]|uniref:EF-hand domain-containing protein n=3 Tax=Trypanozoon TaxID=39700 RepID=Q383Y5_TRYB2|nr:hypothetical protein, conserved [Trypanosoma brucei brucei TREU927]EAN79896.1 hypothetical protein, conserved [Trypanosoma brucei brucei TREU927]RHW67915.1 hypothetical protein DPX39_110065000 [Trypanosoma brucei equiperdum]SCU69335.1 hypothetical protein, conserved [Trypanosoma equiperdum]
MNELKNPMRYSPGVLVGNWYEDMRVAEDKIKSYRSKMGHDADILGSQRLEESCVDADTHSMTMGDVIMLGKPLRLLNVATEAVLAVDTAWTHPQRLPHQFLLTATGNTAPRQRVEWVLMRAEDENNVGYTKQLKEENVLHYGQHIRIANEAAHSEGFLYLHSSIRDVGQSGAQLAVASLGTSKDNIFVVAKPGEKRDDIRYGAPVRVGDRFVLYHAATNQPLRCIKKLQRTSFGFEYGMDCSFAGDNHSRSVAAVTTEPTNLFVVVAANYGVTNTMSVSSLRNLTGRGNVGVLSESYEVDLSAIISLIREGVLYFGGRLGFRLLSKVLGVACNEQCVTPVRRQDIFHGISLMGVTIHPGELDVIFKKLDRVGNGFVVAQEFLRELRCELPQSRLQGVISAFQQLVIEGGGSVDYKDMLNLFVFNACFHPDVEEGIASREEIIFDFINCWPNMNSTSSVTTDMFVAYYTDVSPAIESDERFFKMLKRCWKIPETDAYKSMKPCRSVTVFRSDNTSSIIYLPDSSVLNIKDLSSVRRFLTQCGVKDIKDIRLNM